MASIRYKRYWTERTSRLLNSPSKNQGRDLLAARRDQSIISHGSEPGCQKLRQLPRFSSPTNIPLFKLRPKKEPAPVVEEQVEGRLLRSHPLPRQGYGRGNCGSPESDGEEAKTAWSTEVTPAVTNLINNVERDVDGNVYFKGLWTPKET